MVLLSTYWVQSASLCCGTHERIEHKPCFPGSASPTRALQSAGHQQSSQERSSAVINSLWNTSRQQGCFFSSMVKDIMLVSSIFPLVREHCNVMNFVLSRILPVPTPLPKGSTRYSRSAPKMLCFFLLHCQTWFPRILLLSKLGLLLKLDSDSLMLPPPRSIFLLKMDFRRLSVLAQKN